MSRPTTRDKLLTRIDDDAAALWRQVDAVPADDRAAPGACEQWSVKDLLAHLDAWHELFLGWERQGREGGRPAMPAPGYSWTQTPELNAEIWARTRDDSWDDVVDRFESSRARVRDVVAAYDDAALFTKKHVGWTGSTSVGSYAVSATTSHYDWARRQIRAFCRRAGTSPNSVT